MWGANQRISVDEASLNLVHTPDGRWNIDSLFRTAAALPGPARGQPAPFPYLEATNSRINVKNLRTYRLSDYKNKH